MRDRSFVALCALILVNQMGFGLVTPVLPAFARSFGLDAASVGLVISIYGLARFFANVPAGHLAERSGRRPVLIIGTIITSVASALIATADSLPLLLFYRLLTGLGAATVLTGGQIMVGDIATPERRGRMMSTYQGFFLVGVGRGPTPGGILADAFGVRAPFIAYAIFSALACVVALFFIRETRPAGAAPATPRGSHEGGREHLDDACRLGAAARDVVGRAVPAHQPRLVRDVLRAYRRDVPRSSRCLPASTSDSAPRNSGSRSLRSAR